MLDKLNIECGPNLLAGYRNIDMKPVNQNVEQGDFRNLSVLGIQENSISEIIEEQSLSKCAWSEVPHVLQHWISKLKPGGELSLEELEATTMANLIGGSRMSLEEANTILYHNHRCLLSLPVIEAILVQSGLTIVHKGLNGLNFSIRAKKNES